MKVLHVESGRHLYGGAQQVVYLLRGLSARDVENVLVCPVDAPIGQALDGDCTVRAMAMAGDLDVAFIARLRRVIDTEQPDIVHLHSRRGADVLGGLAARWAGVPCVLSRRVDNPEPRWLVPLKYRLYDRVITISEGIAAVLRDCGVAEHKLRCVRSAVTFATFDRPREPQWFCDEFALPRDAQVLGVVAQLIPRKGHRHLFAALPPLLAEYPNLHVLVFGQGPLSEELAAEARALVTPEDSTSRVKLVGFREDIARVLPNLTALVHPAEREGLGVSLVQAAAAGLPIIASAVGGIPEIVRDSVNGALVPPGDADALGAALRQLLANPNLAQRLGSAGRDLVKTEFTADVMVEGNLAVYTELLGSR